MRCDGPKNQLWNRERSAQPSADLTPIKYVLEDEPAGRGGIDEAEMDQSIFGRTILQTDCEVWPRPRADRAVAIEGESLVLTLYRAAAAADPDSALCLVLAISDVDMLPPRATPIHVSEIPTTARIRIPVDLHCLVFRPESEITNAHAEEEREPRKNLEAIFGDDRLARVRGE